MKNKKFNQLIDIAKIIHPKLSDLAKQNNSVSLVGYCAIGSYLITKEATKHNLRPKLVVGNFDYRKLHATKVCNHSWIQYEDQIVDITATQYNYNAGSKFENIHITSVKDQMYLPVHTSKLETTDCLATWPKLQNPLHPESFLKNWLDK